MKAKLKNIPRFDRPREKLAQKGVKALSDLELIAIILGSGVKGKDVFKIAKDIMEAISNDFNNISLDKLKNIEGIGLAKSSQIVGSIELTKRFLLKEGIKIKSPEEVLKLVNELRNKKQEYFITITIDGASGLIKKRIVFIGTLNQSIVHPREIFSAAITDHAAGVIFVHNHPSGFVQPSKEDILITHRLFKVGELVGINVIDHIIISKNDYYSFKEHRILTDPD